MQPDCPPDVPDAPALYQPHSRRTFLQTTLGLAASLTLPSPAADPLPTKIPIGFLGTAYSHFKEKHALLEHSSDFELVGCHEPDAQVRQAQPQGPRWLTESELLTRARVVVVESALRDHARFAMQALVAGCHVHVEKPPATNLHDFKELVALSRNSGRILQVGYMWRYNPGINLAIQAATQGWLGEVYLVRATMNTQLDAPRRQEWAEFKGGAMFEQGSHLIDAVVRLLGAPLQVNPFLQKTRPDSDKLSDNTIAVLEYPKAMAIVTSAPLQPNAGAHRFFEILGTNGTARVQPLEQPMLEIDLAKAAGPYQQGTQKVPLPQYKRYVDEFRDLAAAVRGERPLPYNHDLELAVHATLMKACKQ